MNTVDCYDTTTGRSFTKEFSSPYPQRQFILRCRHSKKIKVLGWTCNTPSEEEFIEFGR